MTVLNTFLAVAGWVWTVLVVCFAAGYALGYKAGASEKSAINPGGILPIHSFIANARAGSSSMLSGC